MLCTSMPPPPLIKQCFVTRNARSNGNMPDQNIYNSRVVTCALWPCKYRVMKPLGRETVLANRSHVRKPCILYMTPKLNEIRGQRSQILAVTLRRSRYQLRFFVLIAAPPPPGRVLQGSQRVTPAALQLSCLESWALRLLKPVLVHTMGRGLAPEKKASFFYRFGGTDEVRCFSFYFFSIVGVFFTYIFSPFFDSGIDFRSIGRSSNSTCSRLPSMVERKKNVEKKMHSC